MVKIDKPWGYEQILIEKPYVIKELCIWAGHRTSLQYHKEKIETMMVKSGEGIIFQGITHAPVKQGDIVHILAGTIHRVEAGQSADLVILEVSTQELDDIVRIEDDYGRV